VRLETDESCLGVARCGKVYIVAYAVKHKQREFLAYTNTILLIFLSFLVFGMIPLMVV
jgi:ribosomal protein L36